MRFFVTITQPPAEPVECKARTAVLVDMQAQLFALKDLVQEAIDKSYQRGFNDACRRQCSWCSSIVDVSAKVCPVSRDHCPLFP